MAKSYEMLKEWFRAFPEPNGALRAHRLLAYMTDQKKIFGARTMSPEDDNLSAYLKHDWDSIDIGVGNCQDVINTLPGIFQSLEKLNLVERVGSSYKLKEEI
ncbi:hypothetical protein HZA98_05135 [Candidatus Woesearchaeota archaeon]|nr:hypothetical protein [Candidatus Woesearchaeota archaeon]